jgi:HAD superfamily hydrolase (TIGR01458 family)
MTETTIRGVLLDLAGVVYQGDSLLPGAAQAVERLRDGGLPVRFVTNTTSKPKRAVVESLGAFGLTVAPDDVFTPAQAARDRLTAENRPAHLLIAPALEEDFAGVPRAGAGAGAAVIVGDAGRGFTYDALNQAFRRVADGAQLLALAENRTFRDADGGLSLDTGAFVRAIGFAAGVEPVVLGKPAPAFFQAALASMDCPAEAAVMVGDDAESDAAGALAAGLGAGLLVRTGKYVTGAEAAVEPRPTAVVDDLAAAAAWIMERAG